MDLSFVIPAHNEERYISATVSALHVAARRALGDRSRPGAEYEVIVAADACSDRTAELARAAGAVVVPCENRQISKTRNTGFRASRGRWLIFVDADTIVPPEAAIEAVTALRDGATGGGAGVAMDRPVPLWASVTLVVLQFVFRRLHWTGGCFLFCTRESLEAVGGWDETLFAGEEIHLSQALKTRRGRRRFVIIKSPVITSARKVQSYSGWEILKMSLSIVFKGRKGVSSREGLELWYQRREEPAARSPE
jgi:glycosyltransferase involved in cell wall biosynthesis